jgi:hypothetical protein
MMIESETVGSLTPMSVSDALDTYREEHGS